MFQLSVREQEIVDEWELAEDLDDELRAPAREHHGDSAAREALLRAWFADREPRLEPLLAFCAQWRATWRDRGRSEERDRWFDAFRGDGEHPAHFPVPEPARGGDGLSDSVGDGLYDAGVRELVDRYAEFHAEMALWRRHLDRPVEEEVDEPVDGLDASALWVRVVTEGGAMRALFHRRVDEFRRDAWSTGVFSVLPDLDQAVVLAATQGVETHDRGPAMSATISWAPDDEYVLVDLYLHTTVLRPANEAALATMSRSGARCFYLQFDDAIVFSATGAFEGVPLGMLTVLRIAAGAREDGGRFRLPQVGTEMSQIVRVDGPSGPALTVYPSRFCRDGYDAVRAVVTRLHPHTEVRQGWGG